MAIVVASMVVIVLLAVGVLVLAFTMHVVARSRRIRRVTRRWALAAAAALYTARRSMLRWSRRFARAAGRRCGPVVAAADSRIRSVGLQAVEAGQARAGSVATRLRSAAERVSRPNADQSAAEAEPRAEREPVPVEAAVRH